MRQPIAHPEFPAEIDVPGPPPAPSRGTGTRLWLVRHAQVHADHEHTAYGDSDVPLSAIGEEETRAMARQFAHVPLAIVLASPLRRAQAMGRAIAEWAGAPLALDAGLKEVSRGAWQGIPALEFRDRWMADRAAFVRDPWRWKGHGGESDADLYARGWPVVERAVAAAEGRTAVLASHYNLIRALVTGALGLDARASFAFRNRPAHATLLVDAPGGWRVEVRDAAELAAAR